jgi:kanosamine-6-phosphate phosphatase
MQVLKSTRETQYLILCDFDETYYPHERTAAQLIKLHELEEYLNHLGERHQAKTGWVTGSSLDQILQKMKMARITFLPHFIASNLGTEIWMTDSDGQLHSLPQWESNIRSSGFSRYAVEEICNELRSIYNIRLQAQTQHGQAPHKMNFYYYEKSEAGTRYDLNIIKRLAFNYAIQVNINRCNPKAGDPHQAYDIDFIPNGAGKKQVAQFMRTYYNVPFERTIAFGDSGNDIEMLTEAKYGYLLQNATPEAKSLYPHIAPFPYAEGILHVCKTIFP